MSVGKRKKEKILKDPVCRKLDQFFDQRMKKRKLYGIVKKLFKIHQLPAVLLANQAGRIKV